MSDDAPAKSVTYKDIAEQCGVSMMTVSRVLRNSGHVKESTRKKVLDTAEHLGYRPNPLVQTLMSGVRRGQVTRQANIGWITTYPEHTPHSPRMTVLEKAARRRAESLGYGFDLLSLHDTAFTPKRLADILHARSVVGFIIAPLMVPGTVLPLPWDAFPCATIGRSLSSPRVHYTMAHFQHMMGEVLTRVVERGYRRVAFLDDSYMDLRQDHTSAMVFDHYLYHIPAKRRIPPELCDNWDTTQLRSWLTRHHPDVVISGSYLIYNLLQASGISMPEDLGFVALSHRSNCPECTGIRQPFEELAMGAVDLVAAQIHRNERGLPPRAKAMLFEGDWVEGTTLRRSKDKKTS